MQKPYTSGIGQTMQKKILARIHFNGVRPHQNNFPTRGQVPNNYFEIILVEPIVALPFCGVKNVCPLSNETAEASVAI
jgi:hypothetical protein